ncbi:MAG: O-antigen polysaccharide polymerase Wzy [Planctomycetota bacterium]
MDYDTSLSGTSALTDAPGPPGRSLGRGTLVGIHALLLMASFAMAGLAPTALSRGFMAVAVLLASTVLVLHIVYHLTNAGKVNWLSIDVLFMLGYFAVHFSYPLFWVLGLVPSSPKIWISEDVVGRGTCYALIGYILFSTGYMLLADRNAHPNWGRAYFDPETLRRWKRVGWVWTILGFITLSVYVKLAGPALIAGQYEGSGVGSYAARVVHIGMEVFLRTGLVIVSISAALLTGKLKVGWVVKVGLLLLVGWLLVLGDRSLAVSLAMFMVVCYAEYVRRISLKVLIPLIIAGLFVMSVVRIARHHEQRSVGAVVDVATSGTDEIGIQAGLMNFGASVRTLYASLVAVPSQYPYFKGTLKISGTMGIIPFSRRLLPARMQFINSARLLTWWINRGNMTSGTGTTVAADLYCDWGLPGIMIGMLLLGLLAKRIQQKARATPSFTWAVVHMSAIPWFMIMSRYSVTQLVRGLLWPALTVIILSALLRIPRFATQYDDGEDDDLYDEAYDEPEAYDDACETVPTGG